MAEILRMAGDLSTRKEKIDFLQKHYTPAFGMILRSALDPTIKWNLPPGRPPFKPLGPKTEQQYMLYQQARKLDKFLVGGMHLDKIKRELLFIQLLESCDPEDAELLCNAKDKKLPFKGITVGLLNTAFPGIITVQKDNGQNQKEI